MPATVNPFSDALDAALSHLMQLEANPDFKLHTRTSRASLYTLRSNDPACPMPITKGVATLQADLSLDQVINSLRNFESRKAWDTRFEGVRVVDAYTADQTELLLHSFQHGNWPLVSGRDFCLATKGWRVRGDKAYLLQTSVVDVRVPEVVGRVRSHLYVAGWIVECANVGEGRGWTLTYITHVDPNKIPIALLTLLITEIPGCVGSFVEHNEALGPVEPSFI